MTIICYEKKQEKTHIYYKTLSCKGNISTLYLKKKQQKN